MREVEFWRRMDEVLPNGYARVWAREIVVAELGERTVLEALEAGVPCKRIWRAVWAQLELPDHLR